MQLDMSNAVIVQDIPRQIPLDSDLLPLQIQTKLAGNIAKAFFLVLVGTLLYIGVPLDDFWIMFLTLQLIVYQNMFDIPIPANAQLYMEQFD